MVLTCTAAELRPGDRFFSPTDTRLRTVELVAVVTPTAGKRSMAHIKTHDRVFTLELDAPVQVEVDS